MSDWKVKVVRGEQYVNGRTAGDILDFETMEFQVSDLLSKQQIAERAFRAGRRVEGNDDPGGRKPLVFTVMGDVR